MNFKWKSDRPKKQNFKPLTKTEVRDLGLQLNGIKPVENLKELRKNPPNIIIADCLKYIKFVQNWFKEQELVKKKKYVMGLGVFQQLHYNYNLNSKILKPSNVKFKNLYKPYLGQDLNNKTLLVSRTGGVGDLIFILPNLSFLKEKYPNCTIKFACGPQYQPMVNGWECVDEVLDLPFMYNKLIDSDYQAIFEGVIERCKEAETENAYNLFSRWLGLDLPDELLIPKQNPKEDKIDECKTILNNWKIDDFILCQLRASSPVRTPDPKVWKNLINKLTTRGHNVVITDAPKMTDDIDDFIKTLDNTEKVFNFCKYSKTLDYTIAMCSLANVSVSTDSALIHISASVETPVFGIYGPFPGFIRLKTYKNCDWVDGKLDCGPCFVHGYNPCKNAVDGFSPCYNKIDIDDCVIRIEKLMESKNDI